MEITLNHTIVSAFNNVESAEFYEKIFGFKFIKEWGTFAVVKINETLTFDFVTRKEFQSMHYAFKVDDNQFEKIFQAVKNENLKFGSGPSSHEDGKINNNYGGRGVYFRDCNGHLLEIITADYVLD